MALRRDRLIILLSLAGIIGLAWLYLVPASLDMYGDMSGLSAWMMTARWDARYFLLIFLMWCVMMTGMMLPSAAPTILLFARTVRANSSPQAPVARTYAFAAGYLLAWFAFSLLATVLQWRLAGAELISPMMESTAPLMGASVLIAAGIYQWTPLKNICLTHCRSPLSWLMRHWRPGVSGAVRMGLSHGIYCVGCCWMLMLLLFFGGVMNLLWIAAITAIVLVEKLVPYGMQLGRLGGAILLAVGLWMIARVT